MRDQFGREIDYLRLSLTDRCNFRCRYCVGDGRTGCLPRESLLSDDALVTVVTAAARLGITRLKLTGGEPLLRPNLPALARRLRGVEGICDLTLTTNGFLLSEQAEALAEAGVSSVNVSLDTLDPAGFAALTGVDGLHTVLDGIRKAQTAGFRRVKVNCVTGQRLTAGDPTDLAELARTGPVWVRYIESMPLGPGEHYPPIPRAKLIKELESRYGPLTPADERGNGPAEYFDLPGFVGRVGFISARTAPFCSRCNRVRLTADGRLKPCLQYGATLNVGELLRQGAAGAELEEALSRAIFRKPRSHQFDTPQTGIELERQNMSAIGG